MVLITDGWIGFESEIVEAICSRLPATSRVHTIGVGHSPNRSLTEPAARAGRGIEVIVAPGEDATRAASRMVKHTTAPLLVNFRLGGNALLDHVPAALPDLFAGCPALVALHLDPAGGELVLRAEGAQGRVDPANLGPGRRGGQREPRHRVQLRARGRRGSRAAARRPQGRRVARCPGRGAGHRVSDRDAADVVGGCLRRADRRPECACPEAQGLASAAGGDFARAAGSAPDSNRGVQTGAPGDLRS